MRKPRSPLDELPAHQMESLERWLVDEKPGLTYSEARERIKSDFNIDTSEAALCQWRGRKIQERMLERILSSANQAKEVVDKARGKPVGDF